MGTHVARTILAQLGGSRFMAMTGATGFAGGSSEITFRLPARSVRGRANAMRIVLAADDTYRMELIRIKDFEPVTTSVREGVHAGELEATFTSMTGLLTSLVA